MGVSLIKPEPFASGFALFADGVGRMRREILSGRAGIFDRPPRTRAKRQRFLTARTPFRDDRQRQETRPGAGLPG